jgi:hypothetical protein
MRVHLQYDSAAMIKPAAPAVLFVLAATSAASAFTCKLSPDGTSLIVKTGNPYPNEASCTVNCRFAVPGGIETVSCTQKIPGGAADWYVCVRPAAGKNYGALAGGDENCVKP